MMEETTYEVPRKKGWSTGAKVGCGCGVVSLVLVLVCGGFIYAAVKPFMGFMREFEANGYTQVSGSAIDVSAPVNVNTVYFGQSVNIRAPINADIAAACQAMTVSSIIDGDLDFYGQVLTIESNGVITGDVRARLAQVVDVRGVVQGQITGKIQTINRNNQPGTPANVPTATPPAPSGDSASENPSGESE